MRATAVAPANIALIKYWGKKDPVLRLPENNSIAINQSNLYTTTTVEFSEEYKEDQVKIFDKNNDIVDFVKKERVVKHLDRMRKMAGVNMRAQVVSKNNFSIAAGLASSASGFAALTVAGAKAVGLDLTEKELSILARQGSGSACRSIPDGFVEWLKGDTNDTSYAISLYPPDYWKIAIIVVVVVAEEKEISSTQGHQLAESSPFLSTRLKYIKTKTEAIKESMAEKNFNTFGELIEAEALELHAIMLTSTPPLIYWLPATIRVMRAIASWRNKGVFAYYTIDAGPHLHIICKDKDTQELTARLKQIRGVENIIINKPAEGTRLTHKHLF